MALLDNVNKQIRYSVYMYELKALKIIVNELKFAKKLKSRKE